MICASWAFLYFLWCSRCIIGFLFLVAPRIVIFDQ